MKMLGRLGFLSALVVLAACDRGPATIDYQVLGTFPHDPEAYTQGLLYYDGALYESTGEYGRSRLRKVDPQSGEVLREIALDSAYFGEGLARVGDELIQLTWKEGVAFVYDIETFEMKRRYEYEGEGWGLCYDGTALYMTNGSDRIAVRDPETFEVRSEIPVRSDRLAVARLNELECVGDRLYANIYLTDRIVSIDKATGEVLGELDGFDLSLQARRPDNSGAVLNGIAYLEETDVFLMTGKLWPTMFALKLGGNGGR